MSPREILDQILQEKERSSLLVRSSKNVDDSYCITSVSGDAPRRPPTMNLTDPDEIKRLRLSEEEKVSRNRRKNGWNVFYSRFSVDLKHLPYESVKDLVAAENLRGGNAAASPTPSVRSRTEGAASTSHSQLPVSFAEGGGGTVRFYLLVNLLLRAFSSTYLFSILDLEGKGHAE